MNINFFFIKKIFIIYIMKPVNGILCTMKYQDNLEARICLYGYKKSFYWIVYTKEILYGM
jgi:hypothetical protein